MITSIALSLGFLLPLGSESPGTSDDTLSLGQSRVYRVEQTVKLHGLRKSAGTVRWWVAIPDNERYQEVLDFSVLKAPGAWSIGRDKERGNRFLYIEVQEPGVTELEAVIEFTLRRQPVLVRVDPAKVGPITELHRGIYADEVRRDAPRMEVTEEIARIADEVCGSETNPAIQALALLQHVADFADHYSKDPSKPSCGIGSAEDCLTNAGGCCTDLHSLFISLARARGIPTRLQMGYRLNPRNEGQSYDPGYRCWVEYFLPGYGWIPSDIVEADAPGGQGAERWFTGLTEWRLWLNEGRDFQLRPAQAAPPVNTMIIGHAEVDGRALRVLPEPGPLPGIELAAQHSRTIRFTELR